MKSARIKLAFIFILMALAVAISISIAVSMGRDRKSYQSTAKEAWLHSEIVQRLIDGAMPKGGTLLEPDSLTGGYRLNNSIQQQLKVIPDYLIVVGRDSTVYFASSAVARLSDGDWNSIYNGLSTVQDDGPAGMIRLSVGSVVFVGAGIKDPTTGLARVITGSLVEYEPLPQEFTIAVYYVIPAILTLSFILFWYLSGDTFKRIEKLKDDVAAITDGRSLHRRLSQEGASSELAGLIDTLNTTIARLETSFSSLRRFTADASHELKTPLAVLRADIERAMHPGSSKSEKLVALEEALQEVRRMSDLVDSLLTLARTDESQMQILREPVDLAQLTREVYETALILGEPAEVSVHLPFISEVTILGDQDRLRQLFLNLVSNAIKYTPRGGRVDIGLGVHPTTVTFAVKDTGIGIAASDIPHVFERFWRADRVRSRAAEKGGVGLGLAICHWIAQAHGGTLTVSSRLGKGSLFTATLPLTPAENSEA